MTLMKMLFAACAAAAMIAGPAGAASLTVVNPSFEILPTGGLTPAGCGAGCAFSLAPIEGWTGTGVNGLFQFGVSSDNFSFFNSDTDGDTTLFSNGGTIAQTLSALAVDGTTYTLLVDLGFRKDLQNLGTATLKVGSNSILATGSGIQNSGNWFTYTANYTASALDAGAAISVMFDNAGPMLVADNVRVSAVAASIMPGVPEPASWAMMIAGFGLIGSAMRRRSSAATA